MVLRVIEFCRARGHDAEALCREAGLTVAGLAEPAPRGGDGGPAIGGERALALPADANFGLHLAEDVRDPRQFDAGLLLLMASPTVRVALERMVRHQRLWGDGDRATLARVPGGLRVRYALPGTTGA